MYSYRLYALKDLLEQYQSASTTAERFLASFFKEHKKLGGKDRKFLANLFYTYVKNRTLIDKLIKTRSADLSSKSFAELLEELSKNTLNAKVNLLEVFAKELAEEKPSVKWSMPPWILDLWTAQGSNAEELAKYALLESETFIRFNEFNCKSEDKQQWIEDDTLALNYREGLDAYVTTAKNVKNSEAFKQGIFEIQDYGSQEIGKFTEVKPYENVIDACCGAGGKSLQMADMMNNTGKIWALDVRFKALEEASARADKAGFENIEFYELPPDPMEVEFPFQAQCVLVDAPCSGSGVFSRNPDRKFTLTQTELSRLCELQKNILANYAKMCLPTGRLVYATCSSFKAENEDVIQHFLAAHPNWYLDAEKTIFPTEVHDGFYMARLLQKS